MLTLKIENQEIEKIFVDGFGSNKEKFFSFIKENYNKMLLLNSLEKSVEQVKLQENKEIEETNLEDLINELKNSSDS